MGAPLNPRALRRIQHELNDWLKSEGEEEFVLDQYDPIDVWTVLMKGPEGGARLYENELFRLQVKFSTNYPLEPPEVIFLPDAPIHPHIYSNGHICLNILYDSRDGGWSPALTINKICHSLHSMLASNTEKARPPGDHTYVRNTMGRSPKLTNWNFEDDRV